MSIRTREYSGPVYDPPVAHHVSREATFIFDLPAAGNGQNKKFCQGIGIDGHVPRASPRLVKNAVSTYWTVVQDENCQYPAVSEAYSGPAVQKRSEYPGSSVFKAKESK
jgi:hypothetical protein